MSLLVEWLELCRKLGWSGQGGRGRAPAPGIVHFSVVIATRMMIAKESAMLIKVCYSFLVEDCIRREYVCSFTRGTEIAFFLS